MNVPANDPVSVTEIAPDLEVAVLADGGIQIRAYMPEGRSDITVTAEEAEALADELREAAA